MEIAIIILLLVISYTLGSIPFGVVVCKLIKGIDVRDYGSGNIGTTNVMRVAGLTPSILVLAGDMVKGIVPVLLARVLVGGLWGPALCGLAAVLGHNWPVTLKFAGGKGVATTLGVLLGILPIIGLVLFVIWALVLLVTRYVSLASIVSAVLLPIFVFWVSGVSPYLLFGLIASIASIYKHRGNIVRLLAGKEYKIGQRA